MNQIDIFDILEETKAILQVEEAPKGVVPPLLPTFLIDYYDADGRCRLGWLRAKNEEDAEYKFRKENKNVRFVKCSVSARDFDVLEALD